MDNGHTAYNFMFQVNPYSIDKRRGLFLHKFPLGVSHLVGRA